MQKVLMGVTLAAIVATSTDVLAGGGSTHTTATTPPASTPQATTPPTTPGAAPSTAVPSYSGVIPPSAPTTGTTTAASTAPAVGTTTITQGAVPAATPPPPPANERDTVTLTNKIRPNRPLLITGGVLLAGAYVPTAVLTATNDQDRSLFIPVVGPWMHLADRQSGEDVGVGMLIAASGVVQGAGVILMAASLFVPEKIPAATITAGNVKFNISPTSYGRGSAAIGAVGTF